QDETIYDSQIPLFFGDNAMDTEQSIKHARQLYSSDYNCGQAVLMAVMQEYGIELDSAPYLTAGFSGGLSGHGSICGAVIGAVIALGRIMQDHFDDTFNHKLETAELSYEFVDCFKIQHNSIQCKDLLDTLGENIETGKQAFCEDLVETSIAIIRELLSMIHKISPGASE
ncbi:MAG: C-GCAxxG-C-C family protein, partial [Candidatus Thorarchaeota archaeon]